MVCCWKGASDPVCQFCLSQICYVASDQGNAQVYGLGGNWSAWRNPTQAWGAHTNAAKADCI